MKTNSSPKFLGRRRACLAELTLWMRSNIEVPSKGIGWKYNGERATGVEKVLFIQWSKEPRASYVGPEAGDHTHEVFTIHGTRWEIIHGTM